MLLLSPAKTLDFDTPTPPAWAALSFTRPDFVAQAEPLVERLRALSSAQLMALMALSPALAELNVERFAAWRERHTAHNSRAALLAFNGDVYEGLDARSLPVEVIERAQQQLRILSGLYGVLRPLDRIQPYRLEMGRALHNPAGATLYAYWGDQLAAAIERQARRLQAPWVLNLASQEYARAALRPTLKTPVIDVVFEDDQGQGPRVISFFAKRARGLMARHVLVHAVQDLDGLRAFDAEGYRFQSAESALRRLVFRRTH